MLKKEITFEDPFEGEKVTRTFYFNLTKAEITRWEFSMPGGVRAHLESVMQDPDNNGNEIMAAIEDLILRSYGVRDGSDFIKSDELREKFKSSEPYSELFWELCTNAEEAAKFMNAVVPKDLAGQAELPLEQPTAPVLTEVPKPEPQGLTPAEARAMDHEQLAHGLSTGKYVLLPE